MLAVLAMFMNFIGWPRPSGPVAYATGLTLILIVGLVALLQSFLLSLQIALRGEDAHSPDD